MSKVFAALQRLELEDDGLSADFSAEAQEILQQPVPVPENPNRGMVEPVQRAGTRADELPFTPRVLPVRVAIDSPLLPFESGFPNASEQYRIVRTKIVQHPMSPRVIAISSIDPGDGKTTTAINVAAALALKSAIKVLLVDCDLRRGQIGTFLGIPNNPGLTDILSGTSSLNEAIVQVKQFPNLHVLVTGTPLSNPTEVLDSPDWRLLMRNLREHFDYVILDTPPIGLIADSELIHQVADGVVLVVRPDYTTRSRCLSTLATMSEKGLLGVVLNGVSKPYLGQGNSYYAYSPPAKV
jgi:capsular exopolysaccharide synthesis family protein